MTKHTTNTNLSNTPSKNTPESIARLLTNAAGQLDVGAVAGLRHARHAALERQSRHKPVLALSTGHGTHWPLPHSTQQWVAVAILLAVLVSMASYWHHARELETNHHDTSPLDIAILTDDLPMDVFVDQ